MDCNCASPTPRRVVQRGQPDFVRGVHWVREILHQDLHAPNLVGEIRGIFCQTRSESLRVVKRAQHAQRVQTLEIHWITRVRILVRVLPEPRHRIRRAHRARAVQRRVTPVPIRRR